MAKRFTDQDKWEDPFFGDLPALGKLTWLYICDRCDVAGIWKVNLKSIRDNVDAGITWVQIDEWFGKKIIKLDDDKIFLKSFIRFQQNDSLNWKNNSHKPIIRILEKHKLSYLFNISDEPLVRGLEPLPKVSEVLTKVFEPPHGDPGKVRSGKVISSFPFSKKEEDEKKSKMPEVVFDSSSEKDLRVSLSIAEETWRNTLAHFKITRPLLEREREKLARMIKQHGETSVRYALLGPRGEKANGDFDPSQHLSLDRVFSPQRIERFINLGSAYHAKKNATTVKPEVLEEDDIPPDPEAMEKMAEIFKKIRGEK